MKLRYIFLLTLSFSLGNSTSFSQITGPNELFFYHEKQNWLEKILAEENSLADTNIDAIFYHIDLDVTITNAFIKGNTRGLYKSVINNLQSLTLQLSSSFDIDSITGNVSTYNFQDDLIEITLDRLYQQSELIDIKIYYSGIPTVLNNTKGLRYETHGQNEPIIASLSTPFLAHLWFPCKDGPGDKVDSAYIDVSVPDTVINGNSLVVSSNGVLESVVSSDGKKKFEWREHYPIVPYYLMMAISNYSHFQQIYIDTSGTTFPIDYYVFKEDSSISVSGVQNLPQAMELFSNYFGTYPFENEKYGMTQLGFYGAIENQTNTIQNSLQPNWFSTSVHELAHMWFGDMITCESWHHGWLNEGFATYSEGLWLEYVYGVEEYKLYMEGIRYYGSGTLYLENVSDPFGIFIAIIYNKGAWFLHMLRGVVGDDTFFNILNQYSNDSRFRYGHANTEDFQEVCETVSGLDLDFFFDQWIYDEYYPRYNYSFYYTPEDSTTHLSIEQVQSQQGWRLVFEMPIQVRFNFSDETDSLITIWNDQQFDEFEFSFVKEVVSIDFDPDNWILNQATNITEVEEDNISETPSVYFLTQNYPNPFNPNTKIRYSIPQSSNVAIKVFDILGNEIETLVNGEKQTGTYEITWYADGLPSGVYFYQLRAREFVETKKMVLMK